VIYKRLKAIDCANGTRQVLSECNIDNGTLLITSDPIICFKNISDQTPTNRVDVNTIIKIAIPLLLRALLQRHGSYMYTYANGKGLVEGVINFFVSLYPRTPKHTELLESHKKGEPLFDLLSDVVKTPECQSEHFMRFTKIIQEKLFYNRLSSDGRRFYLYPFINFIDHSCTPNCLFDIDDDGNISIRTIKYIPKVYKKTLFDLA
jgi:hypothetical protein